MCLLIYYFIVTVWLLTSCCSQRTMRKRYSRLTPNAVRDKSAIYRMIGEIIQECDSKVKRAERIKRIHSHSNAFQTGYVVTQMDNKLNKMIEIFHRCSKYQNQYGILQHTQALSDMEIMYLEVVADVNLIKQIAKFDKAFGDKSRMSPIKSLLRARNVEDGMMVANVEKRLAFNEEILRREQMNRFKETLKKEAAILRYGNITQTKKWNPTDYGWQIDENMSV